MIIPKSLSDFKEGQVIESSIYSDNNLFDTCIADNSTLYIWTNSYIVDGHRGVLTSKINMELFATAKEKYNCIIYSFCK